MKYASNAPKNCDLCNSFITDCFIDGRTSLGGWANMCPKCHKKFGVGLGTGKGQKYFLTKEGTWEQEPVEAKSRKTTKKLTFKQWLTEVDKWCDKFSQISLRDLEDYNYHDCWESGVTPRTMAKTALVNSGWL